MPSSRFRTGLGFSWVRCWAGFLLVLLNLTVILGELEIVWWQIFLKNPTSFDNLEKMADTIGCEAGKKFSKSEITALPS